MISIQSGVAYWSSRRRDPFTNCTLINCEMNRRMCTRENQACLARLTGQRSPICLWTNSWGLEVESCIPFNFVQRVGSSMLKLWRKYTFQEDMQMCTSCCHLQVSGGGPKLPDCMVRVVGAFPKEGGLGWAALDGVQPSIWGMSPLVSLKHHNAQDKHHSKLKHLCRLWGNRSGRDPKGSYCLVFRRGRTVYYPLFVARICRHIRCPPHTLANFSKCLTWQLDHHAFNLTSL
jgi:hypothetical protein